MKDEQFDFSKSSNLCRNSVDGDINLVDQQDSSIDLSHNLNSGAKEGDICEWSIKVDQELPLKLNFSEGIIDVADVHYYIKKADGSTFEGYTGDLIN
jgi:hypothetical protein